MNHELSAGLEGRGRAEHIDEHVCLDLLEGLLPPREREQVLCHIADCPACEKLFQQMATEEERMRATMVLRSLAAGEVVLERRGTSVRVREQEPGRDLDWLRALLECLREYLRCMLSRPRLRIAGGSVAVAAAAVSVVVALYTRSPESPGLRMLPPYSFELRTRGAEGTAPPELRAGLDAYQTKEFRSAIGLLSEARLAGLGEPEQTIRKIFLGSALAWDRDHGGAIRVLEAAPLSLVPGEWGSEARWTLYVSLKQVGRTASADSLLGILAMETGQVGERARKALTSQGEDQSR